MVIIDNLALHSIESIGIKNLFLLLHRTLHAFQLIPSWSPPFVVRAPAPSMLHHTYIGQFQRGFMIQDNPSHRKRIAVFFKLIQEFNRLIVVLFN